MCFVKGETPVDHLFTAQFKFFVDFLFSISSSKSLEKKNKEKKKGRKLFSHFLKNNPKLFSFVGAVKIKPLIQKGVTFDFQNKGFSENRN